MSDSGGRQYQKLPPGWDCKYDQTTGNCYYINYITKAMQLEDPRSRYRQLQNERCSNESIAMQSLNAPGGSPYHVYPSNNMPAIRAFQTPNTSINHMSTSPLLASSRTQLINDMSPLPVTKSQPSQAVRGVNLSRRSTIQETSFSNQIDTDAVVQKIQNMFPTASENHIRLLLKKYYHREAVVISALQVEKHPVTMPGPFVTPPAQRHLFHSNSAIYMTPPARRFQTNVQLRSLEYGSYSRTASPAPSGRLGSVVSVSSGGGHGIMGHMALPPYQISPRFGDQMRSSPKPHSSPKLKLRYMKTIFPKADETLLLDVLANADDNVQKASEKLISLGYIKKDFAPPPKLMNRPQYDLAEHAKHAAEDDIQRIPLRPKEYTSDEKDAIKQRLKEKYPQIVERIILMALESVNYAEDRAVQILQIVQDEEEQQMKKVTLRNLNTTSECEHEELDGVNKNYTSGRVDRNKTSILKTSEVVQSCSTISINDNFEVIGDEKDTTNIEVNNMNITPSLRSSLKLSTVTMSTKSILDRYRSHNKNKISVNDYLRGTCSSSAIWDKLSAHSRDKSDSLKHSHRDYGDASTDKLCKDFKSMMSRIQTKGPNSNLAIGANESLLLADYVTWNGANPDLNQGQRNLAIGPDASMRADHTYKTLGHNADLCKGPNASLAKGSIYSQQNASANKIIDIKCN